MITNDLPINLKIDKLNILLAKMQVDVSYSTLVTTGNNKDEFISYVKTIIENATTLFKTGRINQLDYDVRDKAYNEWNKKIDDLLSCFPEYKETKNKSL